MPWRKSKEAGTIETIITGEGNMRLTCRRSGGGVEITAVETADRRVVLPETVWGLPVTALGNRAFSLRPGAAAGERVRVVSGVEQAEGADAAGIVSVTLPDTLETVGDYAFYNCFALKELRLTDRTVRWGGGALMNCRSLDTFHIRLRDERAEVLGYFCDELARELDVTLTYPDGEVVRLLFPEYFEDYEENTPARHFDYHIYGGGYPYHHCFWRREFQLRAYDGLWRGLLGMEHSPRCALRLAYYRLRFPRGLSESAAADYLAHLRDRAGDVLDWLLEGRDVEGLAWFLSAARPGTDAVERACEQARRLGLSGAVALLLEQGRGRTPVRREKTFDL